jgi:hypothetical protein
MKRGSRVGWYRGANYMIGYVLKTYPFHGVPKAKVRSNGHVYAVLVRDLTFEG